MAHTIEIPDPLWEWAQQASGKQNPASWLRSLLLAQMLRSALPTPTAQLQAIAPPPIDGVTDLAMLLSWIPSEVHFTGRSSHGGYCEFGEHPMREGEPLHVSAACENRFSGDRRDLFGCSACAALVRTHLERDKS